jgi:hypothetical protein
MAKFSLDCLIHTFHFAIEVNIEFIPLELSLIVKCHRDIIRHRDITINTIFEFSCFYRLEDSFLAFVD